jgi:hypothetical protein
MVDVKISEVNAIPAEFSVTQEWFEIGKHYWVGPERMRLVSLATSHTVFS